MLQNFFIRTHEVLHGSLEDSIGNGWEDTFTEALAFFLSCDREALATLTRSVLGGDYDDPVGVETQFRENAERPDVLVRLRNGRRLFLENKIDAGMQPRQLERYLERREDNGAQPFVALFAKRQYEVSGEALGDLHYRRPGERTHFFWQDDLFPVLTAAPADPGVASLRRYFRDYMGVLGLSKSSLSTKWRQLFEDREVPENRQVQQQFGRSLAGVRTFLRNQGFAVTSVSHKGLRAEPGTQMPFLFLKIGPRRTPRGRLGPHEDKVKDEALSVSLIWEGGQPSPEAKQMHASFPKVFADRLDRTWCVSYPYPFNKGSRTRIEVVTDLDWFLADDSTVQTRLSDSCRDVVSRIFDAILERRSS